MAYIPDSGFVRELSHWFPSHYLSVKWDYRIERWIIWRSPPDERASPIYKVRNDDGSYRPLDKRTIDHLKRMFFMTSHELEMHDEVMAEEKRMKEEKKKSFSNEADNYFSDHKRVFTEGLHFAMPGIDYKADSAIMNGGTSGKL